MQRSPASPPLQRRDQRREVAVAGEQDEMIVVRAMSRASTVSSMSMLPLIFRRPMASVNSLAGLVTTVKPL